MMRQNKTIESTITITSNGQFSATVLATVILDTLERKIDEGAPYYSPQIVLAVAPDSYPVVTWWNEQEQAIHLIVCCDREGDIDAAHEYGMRVASASPWGAWVNAACSTMRTLHEFAAGTDDAEWGVNT